MTIWEVFRALLRRWYILLTATAVAGMLSYSVMGAKGVYWSRVEVTFLAPTSEVNPNVLRTTSSDLVVTAAVVAKLVNGNATWNKMADPATTIVGEGVASGWAVRLPDYGGQWSTVYSRQVLDVQVSGPTAEAVLEQNQALIVRIEEELSALQRGVPQRDRITTMIVPEEPGIRYLVGRPTRALVMVWLLCGAAALVATGLVELRARRYRNQARDPQVSAP